MKIKVNPAAILTVVGSVGVVLTAVTFTKATIKAKEVLEKDDISKKELVKELVPIYAAPTAIGIGTIGCIVGISVLDKKKQASLASAYALAQGSYKKYRDKLKELFGDEADEQIRESIANDIYAADPPIINAYTLLASSPDDIHQALKDETEVLFFDEISKRFFKSTFLGVTQAEYHINRNCTLRGYASLNEFYEFLGIDGIDGGDDILWSPTDGWIWIDFSHEKVCRDNEHYYIIHCNAPFYDDDDDELYYKELQQDTSSSI